MCANLVGLYYQYMTSAARQKTFERIQSCVESRVKLECEKEHQEQLLLSVIPAYIAAEVRVQSESVFLSGLGFSLRSH